MSTNKDQTPAPKVSSVPSDGNYRGKNKLPAEEFLEVGPSHGIIDPRKESPPGHSATTTRQQQEKKMDNASEKENTMEEI